MEPKENLPISSGDYQGPKENGDEPKIRNKR